MYGRAAGMFHLVIKWPDPSVKSIWSRDGKIMEHAIINYYVRVVQLYDICVLA